MHRAMRAAFRLRSLVWLLSGSALLPFAGRTSASPFLVERQLSDRLRPLPYRAELDAENFLPLGSATGGAWNRAYLLMDVDGDGSEDLVFSGPRNVVATSRATGPEVILLDHYPPPQFDSGDIGFELLAADCDGDGQDEIVIGGRTRDCSRYGFWIYDPRTRRVESEFYLDAVSDRRPDGAWDGVYAPIGIFSVPTASGERRALLIACTVGFDIDGRGLLAVDPSSGEVLCRFSSGAGIDYRLVHLLDLDGDGRLDILAGARCPDNLGGHAINGFDDHSLRLMAFDATGSLLWTRELYSYIAYLQLEVGDLDGDGRPEIVTSAARDSSLESRLTVWSSTGEPLADYRETGASYRDIAIAENPRGLIAVGGAGTELRTFRYRQGKLDPQVLARGPGSLKVCRFLDVFPERPAQELVVVSVEGPLFVLDASLRALATAPDNPGPAGRYVDIWQPRPDLRLLLRQNHLGHSGSSLRFSATPWPLQRWPELAAAGALALLALPAYRRLRRPAPPSEELLRIRRRELLGRLEVADHGSLAAFRPFRRLHWYLQGLGTDDPGKRETLREQARLRCREYGEGAELLLQDCLAQAAAAGLDARAVERAGEDLERLRELIDALLRADLDPALSARLIPELRAAQDSAEASFLRLRRHLEADLRADFGTVLQRVLAEYRGEIDSRAVEIQVAGPAGLPACRMDPDDLAFVLDNLVANALRALTSSGERRLRIETSVEHGLLHCLFSDTGAGIPPEDWDAALDTSFTTKEGGKGGLGLPKSRELLARSRGALRIRESRAGVGTTLELQLPLALAGADEQTTAEAPLG